MFLLLLKRNNGGERMIRKAHEDDFSGIHKVFVEVHKFHMDRAPGMFKDIDPLTKDELSDILKDEDKLFIVSDNDGIDGFLDATIVEKISKTTGFKRFLFIDHLGVLKSTQKSGVGRQLMEEAEKFAKENNCTMLVLDVWGFNENAIGFYEHLGFGERTRKMQKFI